MLSVNHLEGSTGEAGVCVTPGSADHRKRVLRCRRPCGELESENPTVTPKGCAACVWAGPGPRCGRVWVQDVPRQLSEEFEERGLARKCRGKADDVLGVCWVL